MTDDLVKRLREDQPVTQDMASTMQCALQDAAADHIEKLEAELREARMQSLADLGQAQMAHQAQLEAEAKLEKALEALQSIASNTCCDQCREAALVARATLAELKGRD